MLWIIHFAVKDTYYSNLFFGNNPIENNMPATEHSPKAWTDFFIAMTYRIRCACYEFATIHKFVVVFYCLLLRPVVQGISPYINKVFFRPLR